MHITWAELMEMPLAVLNSDIEMLQLEGEVIQSMKQTHANTK